MSGSPPEFRGMWNTAQQNGQGTFRALKALWPNLRRKVGTILTEMVERIGSPQMSFWGDDDGDLGPLWYLLFLGRYLPTNTPITADMAALQPCSSSRELIWVQVAELITRFEPSGPLN